MGLKFNPLSGNLDLVDSPNGVFQSLEVDGDITLDDGIAGPVTTLQTITPTANRTVSIPDATGTVALVAGSSGQLVYNNAGANAGVSSSAVGATGNISLSLNGAASTPPLAFTGTWFTGGTGTTTKPQLLIEPAGTTSTAWSTSGTGFGVNAASGFAGRLLDLQVNGSSRFAVTSTQFDFGGGGLQFVTNSIDNGSITCNLAGGLRVRLDSAGIRLQPTGQVRWNPLSNLADNDDLIITRDAANTLAQRNGTNAQTFRLYNTFTDASNYERGFLRWSSNVFEVGPEAAGTGTARPMRITAATLKLPNLPTYADNAAATTGGLVAGDVYKTATGELRITV